MTEVEWVACDDPHVMLNFLRQSGRVTERKPRLFAAACVRGVWPSLRDERSRQAVEIAERYADGQATDAVVDEAHAAAQRACWAVMAGPPGGPTRSHVAAASAAFWSAAREGGRFSRQGVALAGTAAGWQA